MHTRAEVESDLAVMQDIERAARSWFREIGMPEIADDEPLPLEELDRYWMTAPGSPWMTTMSRLLI